MNAKLESVIFVLFVLCGLSIHSQEFSVKVSPQSIKCPPGVPNNAEIVITNVSGKDIWIAGRSLKDGISIGLPSLTNEKGEDFSCIPPSSQSIVMARPDTPIGHKVLFGKGESWKISSGSFGEGYCPLEKDLTEVKKVKYMLTIRVIEGPIVRDIRYAQAVGEIEVEFQKPEGEDLAYIKAVKDWLSKADPKEINGYTAQVKPLTWGELLSSFRIPVNHILLQKFPTSTYAAYAMFGNPGSPRVAMTPEDFLEKVHKPKFLNGAFKTDDNRNILKNEKGENIWLTAEDIQRGIIEKGDLIFKHHPDFVYRDELRFRMAQAYIALYEEKKAVKLFEEIVCDAVNEADRQKAKRYMELLVSPKHKGRLSTEEQSEPKKQEMKEPPKK